MPQAVTAAEMGIWRLTAVGSYVADAPAIRAAGGSRKVCLPGSSLRVNDVSWEPTRDVDGRVVCWRRTVEGKQLVILNNQGGKDDREDERTHAPGPRESSGAEGPEADRVRSPRRGQGSEAGIETQPPDR